MKTNMEKALVKPSSCAALQAAIQGIWTSQQAATEAAQERFHLDDEASILRERAPLLAQIEAHKRQLAALESEAAAAAATQADLARQVTASATRLATLQAHIDASAGARAACVQADATPALRALCRERETLVTSHDTLVTEHNRVVQRRGTLAGEHRRVLERTNKLIDALNWTQSPASHTRDHHGQFLSGRSDRMARPPPMKGPTVS